MKAAAAEWFRPWILIRGLRDDKCHHPAHYVVCDLNPIDYAGRGLVLPQPWFVVVQSLSSVQFSHSVMSDSLWPHELQHARPPCPSPTPRVYSNSCPLSRWCHPTISLLPSSPPALSLFQHQGLWLWMYKSTNQLAIFQPHSLDSQMFVSVTMGAWPTSQGQSWGYTHHIAGVCQSLTMPGRSWYFPVSQLKGLGFLSGDWCSYLWNPWPMLQGATGSGARHIYYWPHLWEFLFNNLLW